MIGTVGFRDLEVSCVIGVNPQERIAEQRLLVDLSLEYDFAPSLASHRVEDVLHYGEVARALTDHLRGNRYGLLESAAAGLLESLVKEFPALVRATVELRKPAAMAGRAVPYVRLEWSEKRAVS
ncbi:MAG: dihydroneopterin aldolase [Spirochaetaceae bacterium]|nr:MAG: dihydroneopterin aldolase [Spirochaetaceae bacterium]